MNKCAYCNHNDVCKHKDNYQEVLSKIVIDVPQPFNLVLNCKHYSTTACSLNDYTNTCATPGTNNMATPYPAGGPEIVY